MNATCWMDCLVYCLQNLICLIQLANCISEHYYAQNDGLVSRVSIHCSFCYPQCGSMWCCVTPCDAVWPHVMLCDPLWCCVTPCDAVWPYVMLCDPTPCDAMWPHVMQCDPMWCCVTPCDAVWPLVMLCGPMWCCVTQPHVMLCDPMWCCVCSLLSPCRNVDLLCSVKYNNNLPDIPFDPKFLTYPFDSQRSADHYQLTNGHLRFFFLLFWVISCKLSECRVYC